VIQPSIAPVLEALELDQPQVVTTDDIEQLRQASGTKSSTRYLIEVLTDEGWLLPLRNQGVWEFAPAARAGAFGSGDPHIELRAALRKRPNLPVALAEETAAWLHGLSGRPPTRDVLGAPHQLRLPPALSGYRVVRTTPRLESEQRNGLPVWRVETLLVAMADRPASYRDWPNVTDWLSQAVARVTDDGLQAELQDRSRAAWMRLAYLVDRGGNTELAADLVSLAPAGDGPYYLGPRTTHGTYHGGFDVIDSALIETAP
jgi:hypothetical protein